MKNNVELLRHAIEVAQQVEASFPNERRTSAIGRVAFGLLVRNRRFAQMLALIPEDLAYEALAVIRCMVELQVNLSWIRKDPVGERAERFLKFEPLERLDMIKEMPESVPPGTAKHIVESLEAEREVVKDLFAGVTANGRTRWAKHWAQGTTLRDRLNEIMTLEGLTKVPFTYVVYRWASSVVHGGPSSIASVLQNEAGVVGPTAQPLSDPTSVFAGAALSLLMTSSDAAAVGGLKSDQKQGIASLIGDFNAQVGNKIPSCTET